MPTPVPVTVFFLPESEAMDMLVEQMSDILYGPIITWFCPEHGEVRFDRSLN